MDKIDFSLFMYDNSEGDYGKEAMLDYQMSYLLRLSATVERGFEVGKRVLMRLLDKGSLIDKNGYVANIKVSYVKVWKQWQHIDVIAEVEGDFGNGIEKHIIVIEDKAYTSVHDNQLNRYSKTVNDWYKDKNVQIHYWVITFFDNGSDESNAINKHCKEAKENWGCLSFDEVVNPNNEEIQRGTGNNIIDEFWIKTWY